MTDPNARDARPDELPAVDDVIHEARESSWHLPLTPPEERHPVAGQSPKAGGASSAHPGATGPHPTATAHAAPPAAAVHPAPAAHAPATGHAAAASGHGTAGAGHGEDHDEPALGPVDVEAWGAGILGTAIGLFMAVCFVLAVSGSGAY
jgi:hypothetical protein